MLRDVRLRALKESPAAFLSTYSAEAVRPAETWEDEASRRSRGAKEATFVAVRADEDGDDGDSDNGGKGDGEYQRESQRADRREPACVGLVSAGRPHGRPGLGLFSMWVAPQARRLGIGRLLVRAAIDWARACGDESVWLWVTRQNAAAIHFYERMGFVTASADDTQPPAPDEYATLMVFPLPTSGGRRD
jgi:ribosomal protein S18 acetylase RimI-like enzyme